MAVLSRHGLSSILFWLLVGLSALMLVVLMLLLGGVVPVETPAEPAMTSRKAIETSAPATARPRPAATSPAQEPATTTKAAPAAETALVVVTASRGDSWFQARLGSENGPVLDERVLAQGESARFEGRRIWLNVGAAGHVDVTVDGKPRALAPGTVAVVLTSPSPAPAS